MPSSSDKRSFINALGRLLTVSYQTSLANYREIHHCHGRDCSELWSVGHVTYINGRATLEPICKPEQQREKLAAQRLAKVFTSLETFPTFRLATTAKSHIVEKKM